MPHFSEMFQNWTLREFAIVLGLVGQLVVQTAVVVWWGSNLNTTMKQVVVQLEQTQARVADSDERQMDLRIRIAVQEALHATRAANEGGTQDE